MKYESTLEINSIALSQRLLNKYKTLVITILEKFENLKRLDIAFN